MVDIDAVGGSEEEGRVTLAVSGTAWALTQNGPTTLRHH
jgi:hypothetical protein